MKFLNLLILLFLIDLIAYPKDSDVNENRAKNKIALSSSTKKSGKFVKQTDDGDILFSSILNSKWIDFNSIAEISVIDVRNTIITELGNRTNESIFFLQNQTNLELSSYCLLYTFLKTASIRTEYELQEMTLSSLRNALIIENANHLCNYNIKSLQSLSTKKLVQLGYGWFLPIQYASLLNSENGKISKITAPYKFQLKDNLEREIHVLKIAKTNESIKGKYKYLGVYHIGTSYDNFNLQLAGSNDLFEWNFIVEIDHDAHQGDIVKWNKGYLIAYEEDKKQGSNNIALKYYKSYEDLILNNSSYSKSIKTSIHRFGVEGTPDIRNLSGNSPVDGNIQIGFHYYDGNIDRLAMGVLQNGSSWKAWKDVLSEYNLREMNFKGNIGSRKSFLYNNNILTLQEARFVKRDWSTWKIMLGINGYYSEVLISTPNGSTSFCNPSIILTDNNKYAVTLFLPTEGNDSNEKGGMIYLK